MSPDYSRLNYFFFTRRTAFTAIIFSCFVILYGFSSNPTDEEVGIPTELEINEVLINGHDIAELIDDDELDMWNDDDGISLNQRFEAFEQKGFVSTVTVEVRLVGFQGFGNERIILPAHKLSKHLDTFNEIGDERVHVGHTDHTVSDLKNLTGHDLNVFRRLLYTAVDYGLNSDETGNHGENSDVLLQNVNKVIDDSVVKAQRSYLPISSMDKVISKDYEKNPSHSSYVIYILNPKLPEPTTDPADGHLITRTPVYWYVEDKSLNEYHPCGLVSWLGSKKNHRYAWIDISAGPAHYGPRGSGNGGIFEDAIPRASDIKNALAAKLATLVYRTTKNLILPPLDNYPIAYYPKINILLTYISDAPLIAKTQEEYWEDTIANIKKLALYGQEINVQFTYVSAKDCPLCSTALKNSIKSRTSTAATIELRPHIHQYIDSKDITSWLSKFGDEYWGLKHFDDHGNTIYNDYNGAGSAIDGGNLLERTIPVYVYKLIQRPDILLLDRIHQSVYYKGVVTSVETQSEKAMVNYVCSGNAVTMNPSDARRATFASILKAVWGISDVRETWSALHGKINKDYLWAGINNPFGPFSNEQRLSFSQYDAAAHNTIFTEVNLTMSSLKDVFQQFNHYNMTPKEALAHKNYKELRHRWNMLNYKFERASKYLSLHDYKHALFFVHSTRADVRYIKNVVARAANGVEVEMTCSGLYSFKEVLLMGPKLGAFWLFMLIFSIMYSIYNCYRNVSNHLNRVMSPDDDNNEGGEGAADKHSLFMGNVNRYVRLNNNMNDDDFDEFLRPTRRIDMML